MTLIEQYHSAKHRHPNMLLLFRVGDFYELFGEDAETATRILGLTLTSRDRTIPMARFPHHCLETHLHTLSKAGQRVAICEQVESPAGKVPGEFTPVNTEQPTLFDEAP